MRLRFDDDTDVNGLACAYLAARRGGFAIDRDIAGQDRGLESRARIVRQQGREGLVQSLAGKFSGNRQAVLVNAHACGSQHIRRDRNQFTVYSCRLRSLTQNH